MPTPKYWINHCHLLSSPHSVSYKIERFRCTYFGREPRTWFRQRCSLASRVCCTLFIYQEWSRDWSAESTDASCRFRTFLGNSHSFVVWVAALRRYEDSSKAREMHRNAACFKPRRKLTFGVLHEQGSKSNHGPSTQAWSGAMCFALKHVQRNPSNIF